MVPSLMLFRAANFFLGENVLNNEGNAKGHLAEAHSDGNYSIDDCVSP